MRGHRDQVTAIQFIAAPHLPSTSTSVSGYLLTSSKDTFLKLWDLSTQHCVQTIVAHRSDIWSMDINNNRNVIFTGSGEGELKAWRIDYEALAAGLQETETGEVCLQSTVLMFYLHRLIGRKLYSSHFHPPALVSTSCISDIISPTAALSRRSVSRPFS